MKKINIPIHKHTPKRYSRSRWLVLITQDGFQIPVSYTPLVTDLQRVPKSEDLYTGTEYPYRKNDMVVEFAELNGLPISPDIPTKKLGFWRNLWQNKIRRKR